MKQFLAVVVTMVASAWCATGVLTASEAGKAAASVDERLAQKVSYSCYVRLHKVAEDLSKTTGVAIRCGRTTEDWRVRDISVTLSVKDMPLGKLLRCLADATHTVFMAGRVTDGQPPTYRLARDNKMEDQIASSAEQKIEANLALARWAWDSLVVFAKTPDAEVSVPVGSKWSDISPRNEARRKAARFRRSGRQGEGL